MNRNSLLTASNLGYSFSHGDGKECIKVLNNVSLDLEPGKVTSVVGPSGCGKSTLLYLLGLLDRPHNGSLMINGIETSSESDGSRTLLRNKEIGFVFQFHFLIQELTVLENVSLPLLKSGARKSEAKKVAHEILAGLGLENKLSRYPQKLSGGERQRVAIALCLI